MPHQNEPHSGLVQWTGPHSGLGAVSYSVSQAGICINCIVAHYAARYQSAQVYIAIHGVIVIRAGKHVDQHTW